MILVGLIKCCTSCTLSFVPFDLINILSYVQIFIVSVAVHQACLFCSELRAKLGLKPLERDDDESKAGM